jgi:hypothetical protein
MLPLIVKNMTHVQIWLWHTLKFSCTLSSIFQVPLRALLFYQPLKVEFLKDLFFLCIILRERDITLTVTNSYYYPFPSVSSPDLLSKIRWLYPIICRTAHKISSIHRTSFNGYNMLFFKGKGGKTQILKSKKLCFIWSKHIH